MLRHGRTPAPERKVSDHGRTPVPSRFALAYSYPAPPPPGYEEHTPAWDEELCDLRKIASLEALETSLADRGIIEGSAAYQREMEAWEEEISAAQPY